MIELGPQNGSLTVETAREGVAARAGHDLVIDVEGWSASLEMTDGQIQSLRATVDATSFGIREGRGGVKPLSDSDRTEIKKNIAEKVLKTGANPEITFESTAVHAMSSVSRVEGRLTMAGQTANVQIPVEVEQNGDETVLRASVSIVQSDFGIKPYRGLMGALKVADKVEIKAGARVPD